MLRTFHTIHIPYYAIHTFIICATHIPHDIFPPLYFYFYFFLFPSHLFLFFVLRVAFQLRLKTAATEALRVGLLKDNDFVFDFTKATVGVSNGQGGKVVAATPLNFPAVIVSIFSKVIA